MKRLAFALACSLLIACASDGGEEPQDPAGTDTDPDPTSATQTDPTPDPTDTDTDADADTDTDTDTEGEPSIACSCHGGSQDDACLVATACRSIWIQFYEGDPIGEDQERENLAALECFFAGLEAGEGVSLQIMISDDDFGQYEFTRWLQVLPDGDALSGGDFWEDLCGGDFGVEHRLDVATASSGCDQLTGSQAQGDCIYLAIHAAALATACENGDEWCDDDA